MHTPSGYSVFTSCSFDSTELHSTKNELDCYRGKIVTRINNYENKEMIPLTDKENKFYGKQKVCYIFKK